MRACVRACVRARNCLRGSVVDLGSSVVLALHSSKVDKIMDIVTGNPTVIKMVVHYTRSVCLCVCVRAYMYVCVCACMSECVSVCV